jgi:hypothetical protein
MDYAQLLWSEYILGLNQKRQRRAIYAPLVASWQTAWSYLLDPEQWARRMKSLRERLTFDSLETLRGNWFNRQAAADAVLLAGALVALYVGVRLLNRMLRRLVRATMRRPRRSPRQQPVEFYQKLERLLAREGLKRRVNQTPREFAAAASGALATRPSLRHLASIPQVVVEAFYSVRFGNQRLNDSETEKLQRALHHLQQGFVESRKPET